MKPSHGKLGLAALALLLTAGCAAAPPTARNDTRSSPRIVTDTWATETPRANVDVRQDAYASNTPAGTRKRLITGSLIPQEVNVNGNSADTAVPVRVYGQGDLRRHAGDTSSAAGLSRIDPAISISGGGGSF